MIAYVEGKISELTPTYVVIDCGGVGYMLNISLNTFSQLEGKERCRLHTHLAIREDAHTLYGFFDVDEKQLFLHLISVSGVGASTARMILSSMNPNEVHKAIIENNVAKLKSVKGIGAKSAQRIIIDLRDKFTKEELTGGLDIVSGNTSRDEALSALVMLGFTKTTAEKAILKVLKDGGEEKTVEELIKATLQHL